MIAMVAGDQRPGAWLAGLAIMPDGGDPSGVPSAGFWRPDDGRQAAGDDTGQ
jgi:hypothetical protein